jgi:hypothetical protein
VAIELRHRKYGHSTKLLEPNVKNSAGSLRDLHSVLWIGRGTGLAKLSLRPDPKQTALTEMLRGPLLRKHFGTRFLHEAVTASTSCYGPETKCTCRLRRCMILSNSTFNDRLPRR